jgi:Ca-activated chloride channel family protein
MEALKRVAADFADERPNDRIGLVVYASEAYTKHRSPVIRLF